MVKSDAKNREAKGQKSGIIGLIVNLCLFAVKLVLGLLTGSIALIADAVNNLSDGASALVTIIAFKVAGKPADKEHPFGHGRTEYIAGLVIAVGIIFLGFEFVRSSIDNIISPESSLYFGTATFFILGGAFFAKLWLYFYNKSLSKKINSPTLLMVAKDCRNDCIITLATVASFVVTSLFGVYIDGFVGIFISAMLLKTGIDSVRSIINSILGVPIDKKTAREICQIVLEQDEIVGVHDLVVHNYGPGHNVATIHAELPMDMSLTQAHNVVDAAESRVMQIMGIALTIHLDPVDIDNRLIKAVKTLVANYLEINCQKAHAHHFRLKHASKDTVVFELEFPYSVKPDRANVIVSELAELIENECNCNSHINLEYGFVEE